MGDSYGSAEPMPFSVEVIKPKPILWRCHLFGMDRGFTIQVTDPGFVPNRFHRWMQKLCFGTHWVRVRQEKADG